MIQIQIATSLDEVGVGGIRWVLLDPSEAAAACASRPAENLASVAADDGRPTAPSAGDRARETSHSFGHQADRTYQVVRAVVLAAALAGAWWMASIALEGGQTPSDTVTKVSR